MFRMDSQDLEDANMALDIYLAEMKKQMNKKK